MVMIAITSLFTKLPWPGVSEETFWSLIQAITCLPHRLQISIPFLLLLSVK